MRQYIHSATPFMFMLMISINFPSSCSAAAPPSSQPASQAPAPSASVQNVTVFFYNLQDSNSGNVLMVEEDTLDGTILQASYCYAFAVPADTTLPTVSVINMQQNASSWPYTTLNLHAHQADGRLHLIYVSNTAAGTASDQLFQCHYNTTAAGSPPPSSCPSDFNPDYYDSCLVYDVNQTA